MKAADKDSKLHWNFKIDKLRQYTQFKYVQYKWYNYWYNLAFIQYKLKHIL